MLIRCLSLKECEVLNSDFLHFEEQFTYDSQDGKFSISHGKNYTEFFKTLRFNADNPLFFMAQNKDGVILGVIVTVLQNIPSLNGFEKAWYLCDFKIEKSKDSLFVLYELLKAVKAKCYSLCTKAYALSMNSPNAKNRILNFAMRNKFLPFKNAGSVNIYALTSQLYHKFLSDKDLWLHRSTDLKTIVINHKHVDLWHITSSPRLGSILVRDNLKILDNALVLCTEFLENEHSWGSFSIIQTGLDFIDWSWVSTCDI